MSRQKYTEDERLEVLEIYRKYGPGEASTRTGVPKSTISGWARTRGVRTISNHRMAEAIATRQISNAEKRTQISRRFLDKADDILNMIEHPIETVSRGEIVTTDQPSPSQLRDLMVSTSIAVEKHLALDTYTGVEEQNLQSSLLDRLASELGVNERDEEFPN